MKCTFKEITIIIFCGKLRLFNPCKLIVVVDATFPKQRQVWVSRKQKCKTQIGNELVSRTWALSRRQSRRHHHWWYCWWSEWWRNRWRRRRSRNHNNSVITTTTLPPTLIRHYVAEPSVRNKIIPPINK